jgi:hypothetical protein
MAAGRGGSKLCAMAALIALDTPPAERHVLLPCEVYQAWQAAVADADEAYHAWCGAPAPRRRDAYAAYRAAADREDVAAERWLAA